LPANRDGQAAAGASDEMAKLMIERAGFMATDWV
jgi:hypothetical protein